VANQTSSAAVARAVVDPALVLGELDRRLFGGFVEHLGRCIYGGIFEPGHPKADADGYRLDVAELVRELGTTVVRYPGGNFASGYDWEDGVGPAGERPARLDLAWRSIEPNTFGLGEMARWLDLVGADLIYTVNLGTRGIGQARDLIEYTNFGSGTALSDLRISHGAREPYGIRTWCLGNEMDGPWQIGHQSAGSYGELAAQAATVMRRVDPGIELVVAGSSQHAMPGFPHWDAQVLERTYGLVDYLSLHAYYWQYDEDLATYLSASADLDQYLDQAIATCDFVQAKARGTKRINIALDEWNASFTDDSWQDPAKFWTQAPELVENVYSAADAIVVGGLLNSIVRHCERVRIACMSLLVNVSAPIMTQTGGPAWRQAIFYPLYDVARFAGDVAVATALTCDTMPAGRLGEVPVLDITSTADRATGEVTMFVVNRDPVNPRPLQVRLRDIDGHSGVQHTVLAGTPGRRDANTADCPDRVRPRAAPTPQREPEGWNCVLPAQSWNVIRAQTRPPERPPA
jgi:alpha-N-arabinofuranosidase